MRIIKTCVIPGEKVYKVTCSCCKSVTEFKAKEAKHVHDQRDGNYYTIDCLVCFNPINKSCL